MPQSEVINHIQLFDYGLCHLPDIFVFRNSFPLKILEYLAAGKKVLCSTIKTHLILKQNFENEIIIYQKYIKFNKLIK
ncbi:MAG: hypothetical protein WCI00_03865 [bacterium]